MPKHRRFRVATGVATTATPNHPDNLLAGDRRVPEGTDAMNDPEHWSFDVTTAHHDDMKGGGDYKTVQSRVTVSRKAFPKWTLAAETAACMAVAVHGGMPTEILARY